MSECRLQTETIENSTKVEILLQVALNDQYLMKKSCHGFRNKCLT